MAAELKKKFRPLVELIVLNKEGKFLGRRSVNQEVFALTYGSDSTQAEKDEKTLKYLKKFLNEPHLPSESVSDS